MNEGSPIDYKVTHRPAVTRRIHLEIDDHGSLLVVAPRRMSRRVIQVSLQRRARHVARFLDRARARLSDLPEYRYTSGEKHLFMGRRVTLDVVVKPGRGSVGMTGQCIRIVTADPEPERVRNSLQRWHRQQAQQHFESRLAALARVAPWVGGQIPPMRLRKMKRTWGSCSSRGVITLNPLLLKAPPACIDYVIAHEICHLEEHNHGKAFYALQEQLYPDWRESKALLSARSHIYLHQ